MQVHTTKPIDGTPERSCGGQRKQLLLVGSAEVFKSSVTHSVFSADQFRIAGRSTTLLDALARLESGTIDLVLLSCEFREEELSLFAFDAKRRGFAGLILHVAPTPGELIGATPAGNRELSRWISGEPGWGSESRERSESRSTERHRISVQHMAPIAQAGSEWNELKDPISLTVRQQAVLTRVSEGWTNQQIAHELKCSEGSVKAVLHHLFKKLGVRRRAQLVRMAFEKAFPQFLG